MYPYEPSSDDLDDMYRLELEYRRSIIAESDRPDLVQNAIEFLIVCGESY